MGDIDDEDDDGLFFTDTVGQAEAETAGVNEDEGDDDDDEADPGQDEAEATEGNEAEDLDDLAKQISELEAKIHEQESSIVEDSSIATPGEPSIYVDDESEEEIEPVPETNDEEPPSQPNEEGQAYAEALVSEDLDNATSQMVDQETCAHDEVEAEAEIPAEPEAEEDDAVVLVDDADASENEVEYEVEGSVGNPDEMVESADAVDSIPADTSAEDNMEAPALADQLDETSEIGALENATTVTRPSTCKNAYVFLCTNSTLQECQKLQVFGSPQKEFEQMKRCITSETFLFLFNIGTWKLVGPFGVNSPPTLDIFPSAFGKRFRAQVRIVPLHPLGEVQMSMRVPAGPKSGVQAKQFMSKCDNKIVKGWGQAPTPRTIAPKSRASPPASPPPSPALGDAEESYALGDADQVDSVVEENADHGSTGVESMECDDAIVDLVESGDEVMPDDEDKNDDEEGDILDREIESGYIFVCSKITQQECKQLMVFGSPERELPQMKKCITTSTWLFLLNIDALKLIGPFFAESEPALDIVPSAFSKKFRAHIRVRSKQTLVELQLPQRIPSGSVKKQDVMGLRDLMRGNQVQHLDVWNAPASSSSSPSSQQPWTAKAKGAAKAKAWVGAAKAKAKAWAAKAKSNGVHIPAPKKAANLHHPNPRATIYPKSRGSPPSSPLDTEPLAKKRKITSGLVDEDGRAYDLQRVVVNFANVGATYASRVLGRDKERCERMFDWEGVRKCIKSLTEDQGLQVIGVLFENLWGPDSGGNRGNCGVPDDIRGMCQSIQETPKLDGRNHKSADDEVTIKCAYRRNCRFLDNDNYRDWKCGMRDFKCRRWLEACQEFMQMRYFFDSELGCFDVLDGNMPAGYLANGAGQV